MTRQQKTPRQRAEEALGVAQRKRDALHKRAQQSRKELEVLDKELAEANDRLDYAKKDPALAPAATPTPSTTNQAGDTAA